MEGEETRARSPTKLIPVQDSLVVKTPGHDQRRHGDFWSAFHRQTQPGHPSGLWERLHEIKKVSSVGNGISLIRVFDVVVWLSAHGQAT